MKKILLLSVVSALLLLQSCKSRQNAEPPVATDNRVQTNVEHVEWSRNAVMYEVNVRQYTPEGTFKAFQQHLPQLKELGVDILWFMPIHPISEHNRKGTLGSYYAVQDYKAVNPEFGTLEDFKELVKAAHDMGFKVLIDWVANHTGGDNVWIAQYPEWFVKDDSGNLVSPYDWTDTYKLDYNNQMMRAAMIDALKYWVEECDIDGYRCDVAFEVPLDFWEKARGELEVIKPIFMLAEAESPELLVTAFDMCYNWPLKDVINQIGSSQGAATEARTLTPSAGKTIARNATDLDKLFAHQDSIFPVDSYLMNQITNHDMNSWEGTEFERLGEGVKAFAVLTYTISGMPLIYTGQEVGLNRSLEFFEKDTPPDWTKNEWFVFYQKLNDLKHSQSALAAGTEGGEVVRYYTQSPDAYVFSRTKGDSTVLVYLNLSGNTVQLSYRDAAPQGEYREIFSGNTEPLPAEMNAWEYKVFVNR